MLCGLDYLSSIFVPYLAPFVFVRLGGLRRNWVSNSLHLWYSIDLPSSRIVKVKPFTTLQEMKQPILHVAKKYGVTNVRIFGSFARGDERKKSDVDLLVDIPEGMTLFGLAGFTVDLEETLHRNVDVVPSDSIKPALRANILTDARPL